MKQAAAIRRASRQARYAMQDLDRRGVEELLVIYGRAAHEVRARIAAAMVGPSAVTPALRSRLRSSRRPTYGATLSANVGRRLRHAETSSTRPAPTRRPASAPAA